MSISLVGVAVGAVITAVTEPDQYEAAMEILVKNTRANPVVTSEADSRPYASAIVTEEELNSEVELLKTHELLERTVMECSLQYRERRGALGWVRAMLGGRNERNPIPSASLETAVAKDTSDALNTDTARERPLDAGPNPGARNRSSIPGGGAATSEAPVADGVERLLSAPEQVNRPVLPASTQLSAFDEAPSVLQIKNTGRSPARTGSEERQIAAAIRRLQKDLRADVVKKTNIIEVVYRSNEPQLAARVLNTLANRYLEKHIAVHRSQGAVDFFQQVRQKYRDEVVEAEARLSDFNRGANVVSPPVEKDITLQKLGELQIVLVQTNAAIQERQQLIHTLTKELAATPNRMVTQLRATDDAQLLTQLRSMLLTFEQKRIEMLDKFEPSYRSVRELDAQIAETRAALATAEKSQLHEETTDRDPTYEWARQELAKGQADLAGLGARAKATAAAVRSYQETARSLEQKQIIEDDLIRDLKTAEENYVLSLRKEEETRITDALDRGRILNVAIAEAASIPSLPVNHRGRTIVIGLMLAMALSLALVFAAERLDQTFRTPDELESLLKVPVLAAIPLASNGHARS